MSKTLFLILATSFLMGFNAVGVYSQVVKFNIKDSESGVPMSGVEVFSHEKHNNVSFTDAQGNVKFDIKGSDTLIFFKKLYHPIYIQIKQLNFDTSHVVILKMVPTNGVSHGYMTRQFDKLQRSEYHFEHDSLSNSSIRITNFNSPSSMGVPRYMDKAFHLVEIGLDNPGADKPKSSYLRK